MDQVHCRKQLCFKDWLPESSSARITNLPSFGILQTVSVFLLTLRKLIPRGTKNSVTSFPCLAQPYKSCIMGISFTVTGNVQWGKKNKGRSASIGNFCNQRPRSRYLIPKITKQSSFSLFVVWFLMFDCEMVSSDLFVGKRLCLSVIQMLN